MPKFLDAPEWYIENGEIKTPSYTHYVSFYGSSGTQGTGYIVSVVQLPSSEQITSYEEFYNAIKDLYKISSIYCGPAAVGQLVRGSTSLDIIGFGFMRETSFSLRGFNQNGDYTNSISFTLQGGTPVSDTVL